MRDGMAYYSFTPENVIKDVLPENFAQEYWGRKPHFQPGGAKALCVHGYDVDAFLRDLALVQAPPFVTARLCADGREFARHATLQELRAAVEAGGVASIKLSDVWLRGAGPETLRWMRALFDALRDAVCMTYLDPMRSEDTDLFLAGPRSQIGAHVDATHVFTFQLFGERAWTIEQDVALDARLRAARAPGYNRNCEAPLNGPTTNVVLRPGDALYVPAYAVHRVTGVDWSVALSLGLRCINEIDVVAHLLDQLPAHVAPPVPTAPVTAGDAHVAAKIELAQRLRKLVARLDDDAAALMR
jgi:ribosomal protein L16 Arg81 hydroxylase